MAQVEALGGAYDSSINTVETVNDAQWRPRFLTGLGKTTLAHVVARHCGYRPVEINASDDRSAAALSQRVLDSAQMRTVTGDARPACIIIDEIDGAVGAPALRRSYSGRKRRCKMSQHAHRSDVRRQDLFFCCSFALINRLVRR